jgi:hypothetical protein
VLVLFQRFITFLPTVNYRHIKIKSQDNYITFDLFNPQMDLIMFCSSGHRNNYFGEWTIYLYEYTTVLRPVSNPPSIVSCSLDLLPRIKSDVSFRSIYHQQQQLNFLPVFFIHFTKCGIRPKLEFGIEWIIIFHQHRMNGSFNL